MLYGCWNDGIDNGMQIQGNPSKRHGFVELRGMSLLDIILFLGLWGPWPTVWMIKTIDPKEDPWSTKENLNPCEVDPVWATIHLILIFLA